MLYVLQYFRDIHIYFLYNNLFFLSYVMSLIYIYSIMLLIELFGGVVFGTSHHADITGTPEHVVILVRGVGGHTASKDHSAALKL